MTAFLTLDQINSATPEAFTAMLDGTYEHSPWVAQRAADARPFKTLAQLKRSLVIALRQASEQEQLLLIRAHPELAGKAMVAKELTNESTNEQSKAGLTQCTNEEFNLIQELNRAYNQKFGFPFILAVRGPTGKGLNKQQIIDTFSRRLNHHPVFEKAEAIRNIHRIAEIRLNDKFNYTPDLGDQILEWSEQLAQHSDPEFKAMGQLTVTYLTPAHLACQQQLRRWMQDDCGFDDVSIDAVGNVVGVYHGVSKDAQRLLTGSHFDTVRNGGKYDGRLGILVPMLCVRELHRQGKRLPFGIEVVAFSEEEGQRYKATFLGSGALTGDFNPQWLNQTDANGVSMRSAMIAAGLNPEEIPSIKRNAAQYLGFVEVHIEQGPVLNEADLPLGVVTSINGSLRFVGEFIGMASHAGTTPMASRKDAATAASELALFVEQRAAQTPDTVATMGILEVPNGSINVVPGHCRFSLDVRATTNDVRDACASDILAQLHSISLRRGLSYKIEETMRASAAPSSAPWQKRWENAVENLGVPIFLMPSGAGHDAMKLHEIMPQAMLFMRGINSGISHNPLEAITNNDTQLCVEAFNELIHQL